MNITESEKAELLKIARNSLINYFNKEGKKTEYNNLSQLFYQNYGAFVSLYKKNKLRGCIGNFKSSKPLYKLIEDLSIYSATHDTRFKRVSKDELNDINIEISVLSPMKKISSVDEIEMGKHGIYIDYKGITGTFLPQVADETNWTREEFLGFCSINKLGLEWNAWRNADVYIYEAIVFDDKNNS